MRTLQDLFNQVIDDVAVIFREAGNETSDVVSTPHRERSQLECGNPPFGALLQGGHVPCGQIKAWAQLASKVRTRTLARIVP